MTKLNIITVGYNEEINLPKLFKSLEYIKSKIEIRHIYVDQDSIDNSLELAKNNGCETYKHENKGYADPDKKWIVENLLKDEDWCLILDCDEEIGKELSDEIINNINNNNNFIVLKIKLKTYLLGDAYVTFKQIRLFKKKGIIISDEIHKYIKTKLDTYSLKNSIINIDNKNINNNINYHINKINIYSENELVRYNKISKNKIIFFLFTKPFLSFIHWYIINKLVIHGISGLIVSLNMSFYTFTIYSKLYEKNISTN